MQHTHFRRILIFSALIFTFISPAHAEDRVESRPNYHESVAAINMTMRANHYNPSELNSAAYLEVEESLLALADKAASDDEFLTGFKEIWEEGPFSHVTLTLARQPADDLANFLDTLRIGGGGALLTWRGDVAVLTVNTMMGQDTIEEIDAAYALINEKDASALIVDLRENGGGAFAVRPLVSHLLDTPIDAGSFVSQPWNATQKRAPNRSDIESVEAWQGWSIKTFWADVQTAPLTRIRFSPVEPHFSGPVLVLTSKTTASAAEMAADALKTAKRAVIVGETTAGEMLSQKIYDISGGFHLSVPIADYYSAVSGRIEGNGITPDIEVRSADALDVALQQL